MSSSYQPEGEVLPPHGDPTGAYIAEDAPAPRRRTRSILSAPGTYVLVGINCAVYLWMVLHGVDPAT
ncbi:MAG TPA: rhomboid family intramembrane serine protease, partial [Edaphobacter sp.]|nr:rhomboid family intramembrane serine protease [Edaphobacter sp.]